MSLLRDILGPDPQWCLPCGGFVLCQLAKLKLSFPEFLSSYSSQLCLAPGCFCISFERKKWSTSHFYFLNINKVSGKVEAHFHSVGLTAHLAGWKQHLIASSFSSNQIVFHFSDSCANVYLETWWKMPDFPASVSSH